MSFPTEKAKPRLYRWGLLIPQAVRKRTSPRSSPLPPAQALPDPTAQRTHRGQQQDGQGQLPSPGEVESVTTLCLPPEVDRLRDSTHRPNPGVDRNQNPTP